MRIIYIALIMCFGVFTMNAQSSPKQFPMPETAGTTQWIKLGTYTAVQLGETIKISIISHIGYNASNEQDFQTKIFFKTSNGGNTDINGFAGNSHYYSIGLAAGGFYEAKWVSNAAGISATSYDLHVKIGAFTRGSTYTVENSFGTWTHIGELRGQNDPGNVSGSICKAVEQFVIGSPTYFNKSQYLKDSQYFYNRNNNSSNKIFGMANDDDRLKIWSYDGNLPWNERFTLLTNGNVGIGTSYPTQKLSVNGRIYVNNSDARFHLYNAGAVTEWLFGQKSASSHNFTFSQLVGTNETDRLTIATNGFVGIGKINPQANLDVAGSAIVDENFMLSSNQPSKPKNAWIFHNPGDGRTSLYIAPINQTTQDWDFGKQTHFENNGNVNFSGSIQTGGTVEQYPVQIRVPESAHATSRRAVIGFGQYQLISDPLSNGSRHFGIYNANNTSWPFWITNDSKIGIGTSNPDARLEVYGNPNGQSNLRATGNNARLIVDYNSLGQNYHDAALHLFRSFSGVERMRIDGNTGNVGIGTTTVPTDYKLAIAGNVIAEKVKVKKQSSGWPDYVFAPTYQLPNLTELENFVKQNSHLPEIPSAAEIEKDGQDLGEMNRLLLKKVEELTLYIINQEKRTDKLQLEILEQRNEISELRKLLK